MCRTVSETSLVGRCRPKLMSESESTDLPPEPPWSNRFDLDGHAVVSPPLSFRWRAAMPGESQDLDE